jgi:hypothetical protein
MASCNHLMSIPIRTGIPGKNGWSKDLALGDLGIATIEDLRGIVNARGVTGSTAVSLTL